jgi:anti-sigma factor RsiW
MWLIMGTFADTPEFSEREMADLSALADGTLDPSRRDEVRARIAASAELTALYERERHVVDLLHEVRDTDRAPAGLRERIEAARAPAPKKKRAWTRTRWHVNQPGLFAGMVTAAVLVLVLVLILPGGAPGAPSISQAAALGTEAPTAGAPQPDTVHGNLITNEQDVYFPDWDHRFGWSASGTRTDKIGDRSATTVYYERQGVELAYTIVAAPTLKTPAASVTTVGGETYRTLTLDGREVVTWERDNHTCVLSAPGSTVSGPTLVKLAVNS